MQRSVEERHAAAAAWVSHGLRNVIAPTQLRLDAWLLRGGEVTLGKDELVRMRAVLQEVVQTMDGLELLRLGPTDRNAKAATPWPEALRALLSCITAGAPAMFEVTGDARRVAQKAPQLVITHLLVDLALTAQRLTPGVHARYCIGLASDVVMVNATFSRANATLVGALAEAVQRTAEEVLLDANETATRVVVQVSDAHEVACRVEIPITRDSGEGSTAASSDQEASSFSVLCIDDNEQLMDALEMRLQHADGFSQFLRSASVSEALVKLAKAPVSLVLVDVHLATSHDAMAAIPPLRDGSPGARVAIFSGSADDGLVQRAMANGADGFIYKAMPSHVLIDAIVRLARGENVWVTDA